MCTPNVQLNFPEEIHFVIIIVVTIIVMLNFSRLNSALDMRLQYLMAVNACSIGILSFI